MFDYKRMFDVALKPKLLKVELKKASLVNGVKNILVFSIALAVINVIIMALNAMVTNVGVVSAVTLSGMSSVSVVISTLIGILVLSVAAAIIARAFKGTGDFDKTIGLMSYTVIPLFVIGVISSVLHLVATLSGFVLTATFGQLSTVLLVVAFLWMLYVGYNALMFSNKLKMGPAVVCLIIGYIITVVVNSYVIGLLGMVLGMSTVGVLTGAGIV